MGWHNGASYECLYRPQTFTVACRSALHRWSSLPIDNMSKGRKKSAGRPKKKGMEGMSVKSGDKRPTKSRRRYDSKGVAKYRRRNPVQSYRQQSQKVNLQVKLERQEESPSVLEVQDK